MANESTYLQTDLPAKLSEFTVVAGSAFIVPGGDGGAQYKIKEVPIRIPDPLDLAGTSILKTLNWRYGVIQPGGQSERVVELPTKVNLAILTWNDVAPSGFIDFQNEAITDPPNGQGTEVSAEVDFSIREWPIHLRVGGKQVKSAFRFIMYKEDDLINETAVPYNEAGTEILMQRYEGRILVQLSAIISPATLAGKPSALLGNYENKQLDFEVYVVEDPANAPNTAKKQAWRMRENGDGSLSFWKLIEA